MHHTNPISPIQKKSKQSEKKNKAPDITKVKAGVGIKNYY